MSMLRKPVLRQSDQGRAIAVVGDVYRFLATSEETDGKYTMWEAIVYPGGGPPPHVHSREEESFYVLEGQITFLIDGEERVAGPGTFANLPIGSEHSFKNNTDRPVRMILSVAPAGLEQMFFEVGTPIAHDQTPPPPSEQEIETLLKIAPNYGVDIRVPGH